MGEISKYTFKRLFLLYLIDGFPKGCYGSTRLQKICFFATDKSDLKPFTFKHWHYGQYSFELPIILEQLISMRYVCAIPLQDEEGNNYVVMQKQLKQYFSEVIRKISSQAKNSIDNVIKEYAFKDWETLKREAYEYSNLSEERTFNTILLSENLDDNIEVISLSSNECEELELSLNAAFIACSLKIIEGIDSGKIKLESLRELRV